MKKIVFALLVLLMMAACGGQKTQGSDVAVGDSATTDSVVVPGDEKHNTEYIRQRIDAVYGCYKNPKYKKPIALIFSKVKLLYLCKTRSQREITRYIFLQIIVNEHII